MNKNWNKWFILVGGILLSVPPFPLLIFETFPIFILVPVLLIAIGVSNSFNVRIWWKIVIAISIMIVLVGLGLWIWDVFSSAMRAAFS